MKKVIWRAVWYELDNSIKCGVIDDYLLVTENGSELKFYAFGFDDEKVMQKVRGEILSIHHKSLGAISEIDTEWPGGYKIVLYSGEYIVVQTEENAGKVSKSSSTFKEDFDTDGFQFEVEIRLL